jgi:hypothetical protein
LTGKSGTENIVVWNRGSIYGTNICGGFKTVILQVNTTCTLVDITCKDALEAAKGSVKCPKATKEINIF